MKAWRPAVVAHDALLNPKCWLAIEPALLFGGWALYGVIWGGVMAALLAPVLLMGAILVYGLAALATNWLQVFAMGLGMGMFTVATQALGDGIGPDMAAATLAAPVVMFGLLRLIYLYVAPIWTAPIPN